MSGIANLLTTTTMDWNFLLPHAKTRYLRNDKGTKSLLTLFRPGGGGIGGGGGGGEG